MKKGLAKRILVSLLTVVMISASVLPMLVSTANVARANENVTNVLTEGVEIDTPNVVKDEMYSDYVKVTFIVNDTETIVKYVKTGDTVTVRSTNSSVGVLVGDAPNGSAVTEDTTIYVKTYNYKDVLNIKKELVNEYGEPDADGYYTLKFTAGAKNMPSIQQQEMIWFLLLMHHLVWLVQLKVQELLMVMNIWQIHMLIQDLKLCIMLLIHF